MPQFPRSQRSVSTSFAPQPYSSGGGYAAPGHALQGVGRQLSSLGASLDAEQKKADAFTFKTNLQKFANEQEQKYSTYRDTIDGDAGNFPTDVLKGFESDWKKFQQTVPQSQRRQAEYYREHFRGQYQHRSYGDQQKIRARWYVTQGTNLFATTILPRITSDLGSVKSGLAAVDSVVGSMAGLPPPAQAKLRQKAADSIFKKWLSQAGEGALPQAQEIIDRYKASRIGPTPGSPRAAQEMPGETKPQGAPAPGVPQGEWSDYRGRSGPAPIRYNNPSGMYPGPSARKFGSVGTEIIGGGHKIAVFPSAVHGAAAQFDLLANKYAGKRLSDLVRVWGGDNSPVQYANNVARQLGISPNTVITREMLADPAFGVRFAKAQAVHETGRQYPLSDAEWQQAHAMAFGGKAPPGAAVPTSIHAGKKGPLTTQDYFDELVVTNTDKIARISAAAAKIRAKAEAQAAAAQHARDILAGTAPFNKYNADDRKVLDSLFNTHAFRDAIGKGDPQAVQLLVSTGLKTNYMPKAAAETVQWLISQDDPKQAAMGHQIASALLARKPYLLDEVADGAKIKKHAETFTALKGLGYTDEETLRRMKEFETPEWEAKKDQRAALAKTEVAKITAQDVANVWDNEWFSGVSPNGMGNDAVALGQYKELFRENLTRFGDVTIAKKITAEQMKRMWNITEVSGTKTLMRYPPEKFYKPVGNVKALKKWFGGPQKSDHAWMTTDLQRTIRASTGEKIDPANIAIAADAQTQREVMRGEPPSYTVLYKDKNGVIQGLYGKRWTPDQKGAEDAFAKAFEDKRRAAEEEMKQKAETERRANKAKKEFGDQLKRLAPIKR